MTGDRQLVRSNSRKMSAFSCGLRPEVTQPVGKGRLDRERSSFAAVPPLTCRSVNTIWQHCIEPGAPTVVWTEKYCHAGLAVPPTPPGFAKLTQSVICAAVTLCSVTRAYLTGSWPSSFVAATAGCCSQLASAMPLAKRWLTV